MADLNGHVGLAQHSDEPAAADSDHNRDGATYIRANYPTHGHGATHSRPDRDAPTGRRRAGARRADAVFEVREYLQERADRGRRDLYEAALAQVPDDEPAPHDRVE